MTPKKKDFKFNLGKEKIDGYHFFYPLKNMGVVEGAFFFFFFLNLVIGRLENIAGTGEKCC